MSIPDRISDPGTVRWCWSGEKGGDKGRASQEWACNAAHASFAMSWPACLSRFGLIEDKGSLIGCRCAALMSSNPPSSLAFPAFLFPLSRAAEAHLHICHSVLCGISHLLTFPLSACQSILNSHRTTALQLATPADKTRSTMNLSQIPPCVCGGKLTHTHG